MANWITVRRSDGYYININLDMCSHIARTSDAVRVSTPAAVILLKGDEMVDFEEKLATAWPHRYTHEEKLLMTAGSIVAHPSTVHLTAGSSGSPVHASSV
jgi:hypothetical protein